MEHAVLSSHAVVGSDPVKNHFAAALVYGMTIRVYGRSFAHL